MNIVKKEAMLHWSLRALITLITSWRDVLLEGQTERIKCPEFWEGNIHRLYRPIEVTKAWRQVDLLGGGGEINTDRNFLLSKFRGSLQNGFASREVKG
jgi:hypothetical protein